MTSKTTVFVLMPFSEEFDSVYTGFIKPSLEQAGFDVQRADDIESQRSILRDILEKINTSNLIVADLTGLNPNVFYELGLAHALQKPVILLTQVIEEVPFDLQSYRLIEYSTHFGEIQEARDKLKSYGEGFLNRTIPFGNPVTDFLPSAMDAPVVEQSLIATTDTTVSNGELGLLDHNVALTDGSERVVKLLEGSGNDLNELTHSLEESSAEMTRLGRNTNADTPRAMQRLSRRLAKKLNDFTDNLKKSNAEYSKVLNSMEDSMEFVIALQLQDPNASDETAELLSSLLAFEKEAAFARDSYLDLASEMESVPRMERNLNMALSRGSAEILNMASTIERHIAAMSRVRQRYG